jgi:hypothetical protein
MSAGMIEIHKCGRVIVRGAQCICDPEFTTGRLNALRGVVGDAIGDAYRQGRINALRDAADRIYNGAVGDKEADLQALYNDGAASWLSRLADELEYS